MCIRDRFESDSNIGSKVNTKYTAMYSGSLEGTEIHSYGKYLKISPGGIEAVAVDVSPEEPGLYTISTVSYTHLYVYKRQVYKISGKLLCEASMECSECCKSNRSISKMCIRDSFWMGHLG